MLLYDIFYDDKSVDAGVPLPARPPAGAMCAVCVNGPREYCVPGPAGDEWMRFMSPRGVRSGEPPPDAQ